jgi:hypothetical protein
VDLPDPGRDGLLDELIDRGHELFARELDAVRAAPRETEEILAEPAPGLDRVRQLALVLLEEDHVLIGERLQRRLIVRRDEVVDLLLVGVRAHRAPPSCRGRRVNR